MLNGEALYARSMFYSSQPLMVVRDPDCMLYTQGASNNCTLLALVFMMVVHPLVEARGSGIAMDTLGAIDSNSSG